MIATLLSGYTLRPPVMAEAQGVADLIAARDMTDFGATDASMEEVRNYWEAPRFDLQQDARLIVAPDGLIVGLRLHPRGLCQKRSAALQAWPVRSVPPAGSARG